MFVYKKNKLYILDNGKVMGVNFSPLFLDKIEGTEENFDESFKTITPYEVRAKFNITEETPYMFPIDVEVEDEFETILELDEEILDDEIIVEEVVETPVVTQKVSTGKNTKK